MTGEAVRIVLDVDLAEDSLTGRASASDGSSSSFAGWLGLLNALETLLPGPRAVTDYSGDAEPPGEADR